MKKQVFKFQPFSKKQRKVLNWWCDSSPVKDADGIIADGAIRSGKQYPCAYPLLCGPCPVLMVRTSACVVKQLVHSDEMYCSG